MRKINLFLVLALLLMLASAGLTQAQEETAEVEPWVCPEGFEGQTLRIFSWSTYTAEDTIPNFEEACGVEIDYNIMGSNEELLTVMRSGTAQYDIILPTDYAAAQLIQEGLVQPINWELVPNRANIAERFLSTPYDPEGEYLAAYQWGTIGIGYNIDFVGEEITSWEQVFNYGGPVAWLDDLRNTFGIALSILGYDPNTTNPDEIAEATEFLIENGQNVVTVAQDDGQVVLERGDADIVIEYSGDIFQVIDSCDCDSYRYVIPEEGAVVWSDMMAIPANAANPDLAATFIDYILHPQVGADLSNFIAYGTPNQAALDLNLIDPELRENPGIYPSEEVEERLFFITAVGEAEQIYTDAWNEVLVSLGAD